MYQVRRGNGDALEVGSVKKALAEAKIMLKGGAQYVMIVPVDCSKLEIEAVSPLECLRGVAIP